MVTKHVDGQRYRSPQKILNWARYSQIKKQTISKRDQKKKPNWSNGQIIRWKTLWRLKWDGLRLCKTKRSGILTQKARIKILLE